jgi:probable rRNA maturation factor
VTRFQADIVVRGGGPPPISTREAARFVRLLARRLAVPHVSAAVAFVDDAAMQEMNGRYRGKDRSTDVLSFPADDAGHLGDIAIATPTARRQARRRRHPAGREARLLILHGFLHLLGYDHETDDGQMALLERGLREELIA